MPGIMIVSGQLGDECTVTVNGQTVSVNADGSFRVTNIPAGTALLFPSTTSLISRYSDPREVGQIHGVQLAFGGTSRLLAPIWAGAVYPLFDGAMPFWIGAGVVALTMFFSLNLHPGEAPKVRLQAADVAESG